MIGYASAANFDELSSFIIEKRTLMRPLESEWADMARKAIQHRNYDRFRFAVVETRLNTLRPELRRAVIVASEHFTDAELRQLRRSAKISKTGWRALKDSSMLTLINGFSLIVY